MSGRAAFASRSGRMLALATAALLVPGLLAAQTAGTAGSCPAALHGAWTGTLEAHRLFGTPVEVWRDGRGGYTAMAGGAEAPAWMDGDRIRFQPPGSDLAFDLRPATDGEALEGFVRSSGHLVHVELPRNAGGGWGTTWSVVGSGLADVRLDLYVDDDGEGGTGGYFFFRDPRLPALFGEGVTCGDDGVVIRERNLGMRFEGASPGADGAWRLSAIGPAGDAPITFRRMAEDEVPEAPDASVVPARALDAAEYGGAAPDTIDDLWPTARPTDEGLDPDRIAAMIDAVEGGPLEATHAVLVARHGRLVVEEYFFGYDRESPHDLRSASKTLASVLVGLAVRDGVLPGDTARALPYLPYRSYANWDPRKARITLRDLMSMSSGLDANDYDRNSPAAEGAYQSQPRPDWVKVALDAPMLRDPGAVPQYGGANPLILGGVLSAALDEPLEWFAHRTLFAPLGIRDYRWFTVPTGDPYLGGGVHMRPRDLLKIGQLYLDGGTWRGEPILPASWIEASFGRYGRLHPLDVNGHEYGYLWWHHAYEVDGRTIETVEARGYGGQYLFVVPELDLVVVVNAGNYRNGRTRQSEDVLGRYVLPAVR